MSAWDTDQESGRMWASDVPLWLKLFDIENLEFVILATHQLSWKVRMDSNLEVLLQDQFYVYIWGRITVPLISYSVTIIPKLCGLEYYFIFILWILWVRIWQGYDGDSLSLSHKVWGLSWEDLKAEVTWTWWLRAEVISWLACSVTCLVVGAGCQLLNRGCGADHFSMWLLALPYSLVARFQENQEEAAFSLWASPISHMVELVPQS